MVGWYHWFNGHELGQTLGDGEGQGYAAVHGVTKSWDTTWRLNTTTTSLSKPLALAIGLLHITLMASNTDSGIHIPGFNLNLASKPGILGMLLKFSKSSFSHVKMETISTNLMGLLWTAGVLTDSVAHFKFYSWAAVMKLLGLELGVSAFTLEIQTDANPSPLP